MKAQLHHCNVLRIEDCGILIEGPSGSGKSSLSTGLIERAQLLGRSAILVSDDQAFLETCDPSITAKAPDATAGKIELRGYGIIEVPHTSSTEISLIVKMVDDAAVERMPEPKSIRFFDTELPVLEVPTRHEQAAVRIIFAWMQENILSGNE